MNEYQRAPRTGDAGYGCQFLVSADAVDLLEEKTGYHIHDHGSRILRGRQTPMQVYEVEMPNAKTPTEVN